MSKKITKKYIPYISNDKKKEIKFLFKIIDTWMIRDILRMRNTPILAQSGGNLNFPLVLYLFACMEFLGSLITEKERYKQNETKKRIWFYIETTFRKEEIEKFKRCEDSFVKIFRNGLIHQYSTKGAGISRGSSDILHFSQKRGLILDADKFADAFIRSTKKFKGLFRKKKYLVNYYYFFERTYSRFTKKK